ncbi:hypothetical protein M8C13_05055 [Crossiella sp. SN42]|uniref:hypothetical protein n=1 Tax=Crossiella sp. SN42 TaxID=2944808 RepID=UPI00207D0550|nr:hypothetical protein [Crossiella sp. SN42]MCO1575126.1 hypothetical protein [Crossiella sp. SN42]
MRTWLVHIVGDADLGVPKDAEPELRTTRVQALRESADPSGALVLLDWPGPVTASLSPLAAATRGMNAPAALVLVATAVTKPIAEALAHALTVAPAAFGVEFGTVVIAEGDLAEARVTTAVAQALAPAASGDQAVLTWGSGSTQLALGVMDAVIDRGLRWRMSVVGVDSAGGDHQIFDPTLGLRADPMRALARRWGYTFDSEAGRWHRAHLAPDLDGLGLLVADLLTKGDATSGFAVREYIWARYRALRDPAHPDLRQWAEGQVHNARPTTGRLLGVIERLGPHAAPAVRAAVDSTAGAWLTSQPAKLLNRIGARSSHSLLPPCPQDSQLLRRELGMTLATTAWYLGVLGDQPEVRRNELFLAVHDNGADRAVVDYLGFAEPADVPRRYLVLGTPPTHSHAGTYPHTHELAARLGTGVADLAPATPEAAHALLTQHWAAITDQVGAIVLIPSGPKPVVLPVLLAAYRIAAENGIPLYVRELANDGTMHRLVTRFGAHRDLLELAGHALSTVELDVAARVLEACGQTSLADRARRLAIALSCRTLDNSRWPTELPDTGQAILTRGLLAQRLLVCAELAARHTDPGHTVRALCAARAVIEESVRKSATGRTADQEWVHFRNLLNRSSDQASRLMAAVIELRDALPIVHGPHLSSPAELARLIADKLTTAGVRGAVSRPTAATVLAAAAHTARAVPALGMPMAAHRGPMLSELFAALRDDVAAYAAAEWERLVAAARLA